MVTVCKQNSRYYPGLFVQHHFLLTLISSIKCIKDPTFIRHGQSMSQQHYHNAYYRHI